MYSKSRDFSPKINVEERLKKKKKKIFKFMLILTRYEEGSSYDGGSFQMMIVITY